jgi:hypothetical protein
MDDFAIYRDYMRAALVDFTQHAERARQIRDRQRAIIEMDRAHHPHVVGGVDQDPDYELAKALATMPKYGLVAGDRDSARKQAMMYALAAVVEGLALLIVDR